jgi:hypothetical protein
MGSAALGGACLGGYYGYVLRQKELQNEKMHPTTSDHEGKP